MKTLCNRKTLFGMALGALATAGILYKAVPKLMILEDRSLYDFDTSTKMLEDRVKAMGWKLATVHDMQETLRGFGHDIREMKIYELCSSKYSVELLKRDAERKISPMMPCRVSIYTKSDGFTYISRMNSSLVSKFFPGLIDRVMQGAARDTELMLEEIIN